MLLSTTNVYKIKYMYACMHSYFKENLAPFILLLWLYVRQISGTKRQNDMT